MVHRIQTVVFRPLCPTPALQEAGDKAVYKDIFEKDPLKRIEVTETFKELIEIRDQIKEEIQSKQLDPCTLSRVLRNSDDLPNCIDNYSSGK